MSDSIPFRNLKKTFNRISRLIVLAIVGLPLPVGIVAADEPTSFNEKIRPIFAKHCLACHGGVKQAAGLSFVYENQVVGEQSWVVEIGNSNDSLLFQRVSSEDPDFVMPPPEHGHGLSDEEKNDLRTWIDQGARWERHWAFEKPVQVKIPDVNNKDWPNRDLDFFVLNRLESNKIIPAEDATAERWLRRATLDLTGLPPKMEDRAQFLNRLAKAGSYSAIEEVYSDNVARLVGSKAFGERWASVWLDQIRYADSKGLGADGRRSIWKYRDWVIQSINNDLPFNQFTIKQIAGDLLPSATMDDLIATAVHRLTQTNEEGGTDDEEFRIAAVLDRVNTTWQAWQGVTFGCVQCHSHPYDPIRHEEYYQFAAFFNNTTDTDLGEDWPTIKVPYANSEYEKARQLDKKIEKIKKENWRQEFAVLNDSQTWTDIVGLQAKTNNQTKVRVERKSDRQEFHTVGTVSSGTDIILSFTVPKSVQKLTAIRLVAKPLVPKKAVHDSEWGFSLSHVTVNLKNPDHGDQELNIERLVIDEPLPFLDPQLSLDPKNNAGFSAYTRIYRPRSAALLLAEPVDVTREHELEVTLKHRKFMLSAYPLTIRRGYLSVSDSDRFSKLMESKQYVEQRATLSELEKQRAEIRSVGLPVLQERPMHLSRSQHVFVRGLFLDKGKEVVANTPSSFSPIVAEKPRLNRRDLAKWLVSPENPLTARVFVNRVWARLFGIGLVSTEEDFGTSGEAPSHPKLLDHLASRFQNELGWSLKELVKEVVLSRAYRQSSAIRAEIYESDPQNRLFSHGPRHRLSAEIIRDQSLAIAGLLSEKMFGPPVHPPIPNGVWNPFSGDKWATFDEKSADRYCRSIYTYTKRSIPYPMFAAFDAPSREFCQPRRLRSNTPVQALMMLNDKTYSDCCAAFAKRMLGSAKMDSERLRYGFVMATCREPSDYEVTILLDLLEQSATEEEGFQMVASTLLNLDEVVNK